MCLELHLNSLQEENALEDNKKSGKGRDLGDLKARLGLKKSGAPTQSSTADDGQGRTTGTTGPQAILPPPIAGVGPQAHEQNEPVAPADPRRDPFSAQQQQQAAQLAAFYGIGAALPGSADALGDSAISKPTPWSKILPYVGLAVAAMFIGLLFGRLTAGRAEYNQTIDHAAKIRDEVTNIAKNLDAITQTINGSKDTLKGNIDLELTPKLAALELKRPDTGRLFRTNYAQLDNVIIERLMTYYNDTIQLYADIESHIKKTESDRDSIHNFVKNGAGKSDKNFGVIMDLTGAIPIAQMVEVGTPVCNKPGVTDCNASELKGFKFRTDAGASWGEKPLRGKPGETLTPLNQTPFFKSIASGSPDILAVKDYARRLARIQALINKLTQAQKDVLSDMQKAADKPHLIAF